MQDRFEPLACDTCATCIFLKKSMFRPIPPSSRTRTSPRQRTRSNSQVNLDSLYICVLMSFNNQRWVVLPLEPFLVGGLPAQPWGQPHVLHPRPDVDRLCQVRMAGRTKKLTKAAQDRKSNTRRVPAASALGFRQTRPTKLPEDWQGGAPCFCALSMCNVAGACLHGAGHGLPGQGEPLAQHSWRLASNSHLILE